ncbi:uncharacterized protein LOC34622296 [Cyclospora cayetanensis]|uniref:Uncharacterized protein LOC34622296 n=2 Tax=Cyclospora cayetanensis TaxID=88456 RepID=A0A6P5WDV8_9EIME|nr:uncharacterized protein LOC34622296 [Cyclospora cayetanensis]OEH79367.1 hypothetical protein cyc_06042 [Cyclospora cayetanensis]
MATLRDIRMPTWQELQRYLRDPEILTAEVLFLVLTLSNIFVVYRLFLDVVPFPVFVTWWQLAQGLLMAWCLGELGHEYPKFAYFPRVEIDKRILKRLLVPTIVNALMLVLANVLLYRVQCIATLPVVVAFAVVLHHITRFVGCGEEYMPMRWQAIGLLFLAFILGITDPKTVGSEVLPWALLYAIFSAAFRAAFLQKVMHEVEGKGNLLHNHQHLISIIALPVLMVLCGEGSVLSAMPLNPSSLYTWQTWGCLVTVGALPFLKNIVSNRLIRRTGQGPWRCLEVLSIVLVFIIGITFGSPGWQGYVAILLVVAGRALGACDVLINAAEVEQQTEMRGGGAMRSPSDSGAELEHGGSKQYLQSIEEDSGEAYGELPEAE